MALWECHSQAPTFEGCGKMAIAIFCGKMAIVIFDAGLGSQGTKSVRR